MKSRDYLRLGMPGQRSAILVGCVAAVGAAALLNHAFARRSERRNPPTGRFIEVDGVPIHYTERGSGRAIVLLHGNGVMAQDFDTSGVLDLLAREYRVIVFDRPGFGHTKRPRRRIWTANAQAELLDKAFRQIGVQRPILVGHSWGTLVALAMALGHPTHTAGLVLISGYYFPSFRGDVLLSAPSALPALGDILRYTISPLLGWLSFPLVIRKLFAPSPVPTRFTSEYPTSMSVRPSQLRATAEDTALMIPSAAQLAMGYGEIAVPTAILAGRGDRIVDPDRQAKQLHAAIPGSRLRVTDGVGHMLHHAVPEQVLEAVRRISSDEVRIDAE